MTEAWNLYDYVREHHFRQTTSNAADSSIWGRLVDPVQGHVYLSTGCLHGHHDHCNSSVNIEGGPKEPGVCKWCPARCVCRCHGRA